jgi:hypothetical protein
MPEAQNDDAIREDQIKRLVKQFEATLRKRLKNGVRPLHEIEQEVEEIGETVKETITRDVIDAFGNGYRTSRALCECGNLAKYGGDRNRAMVTLHGDVCFCRSYYYCSDCKEGFCPLDCDLRIGAGRVSRSVQALIARFCSYLPFEMAGKELEEVCGIELSTTTIQRYAKRMGDRIGREWDCLLAQVRAEQAPPSGLRPKRLYESMDGVKVHIGGNWRDVKLGVAYHRSPKGIVNRTAYYGSTEHSRDFGPRMLALGHRLGADCCSDIEVVADGAEWIWQETGKYQPRSVQVLDYYHLTEHLWEAANARFKPQTAEGRQWITLQEGRLLADEADLVIQDVRDWRPRKKASIEIRRKLIAYMLTHRHRMNYQSLRAKGYDIGSGIMEASCKTVVKSRMSAAGMRWEEPGANAVLNLSTHWRTTHNPGFLKYAN